MSIKITAALAGAEQLIRAIKLANPETHARVAAAIRTNTKAVTLEAKGRAPIKTGELAGTIRDEYAADGLVGFVKVGLGKLPRRSRATTARGLARAGGRARKVGLGAYAPVVERGDPRRHHQPHPFLMPAFRDRRETAMADIKTALDKSLEGIGQ